MLPEAVENIFAAICADPRPYAFLGGVGLFLCWLVITKSLPYALAPSFPDVALGLNPDNPAALMVKAEQIRQRVLKLPGVLEQGGSQETRVPAKQDTIVHLPEAKAASAAEPWVERDALRSEVRRLATRTIAADPLNAKAYRLLAEMTGTREQIRMLMWEAVKRSRREAIAQFWLLIDSTYQKKFGAAIDHADILLRTRPELSDYILGYLASIADDEEGRALLTQELAKGPAWRPTFFATLPKNAKHHNTPLKVMMALKESGKPVTDNELAPYLTALIEKNLIDYAYNIWLQLLPETELGRLGLITHPNFEHEPTGIPFDWQVARGVNSIAEFVAFGSEEHALHVTFGSGRTQFPEVKQVVFLASGKYHLEGRIRGTVIAKRGLRWELRCANGSRALLGETEMLVGQSYHWRTFSFELEVPKAEDCRGQTLRLFHDSRSASEEIISGEVWFTGLHFERVSDSNVDMQ
jgi:hypothetical protein